MIRSAARIVSQRRVVSLILRRRLASAPCRDALAGLRDLPGAGGPVTVDADRNELTPACLLGFRDGNYPLAETIHA